MVGIGSICLDAALLSPNYIIVEEDNRGRSWSADRLVVEPDELGRQPSMRPGAVLEETKREKAVELHLLHLLPELLCPPGVEPLMLRLLQRRGRLRT
ncbi:hypothetical protein [Rhizobium halophilum]|uniref:hypothetical protein n=1 Tax=Rhizobium halophilum TaxID=2846852 RepID=UPI001EFC6CB9|nr:hypothetical protein [Rhizobium halophilum]MCF6368609.1 hypothetical protein [Rhizobium halophilum]